MLLHKTKPMKKLLLLLFLGANSFAFSQKTAQPLPEHPRPDLLRTQWLNLNGSWDFAFDSTFVIPTKFAHKIQVPFPWGSKLSGVKDEADVAWYHRTFQVPASWGSKRVFLNIGASDWHTSVYVNGKFVGEHKGGYTPFDFDVTSFIKSGQDQRVDIRVDDKRRMFTLYGKQGYGNARGLWQTVYLDARGADYIDHYAVYPNIDKGTVLIKAYLGGEASKDSQLSLKLSNGQSAKALVKKGSTIAELS